MDFLLKQIRIVMIIFWIFLSLAFRHFLLTILVFPTIIKLHVKIPNLMIVNARMGKTAESSTAEKGSVFGWKNPVDR